MRKSTEKGIKGENEIMRKKQKDKYRMPYYLLANCYAIYGILYLACISNSCFKSVGLWKPKYEPNKEVTILPYCFPRNESATAFQCV